jgi:hypothetical protein
LPHDPQRALTCMFVQKRAPAERDAPTSIACCGRTRCEADTLCGRRALELWPSGPGVRPLGRPAPAADLDPDGRAPAGYKQRPKRCSTGLRRGTTVHQPRIPRWPVTPRTDSDADGPLRPHLGPVVGRLRQGSASSTWNATASTPQPEVTIRCCSASSRSPPPSGTTTTPAVDTSGP